jgi:thiol-disulfide isomerase/thioredoxin
MPDFRPTLLIAALVLAGCERAPAPAAPVASAPAVAALPPPHPDACAPQPVAPAVDPEAPKPDSPTLVIDTWDDGCFDLSAQRGKWVVVNFWATWCNPCLKEIPDLAEFDATREDVQVVGLAFEDITREDMAAFLVEHPVAYPFAIVDTTAPPADFRIPPALPMTVLVAPDGKVAKTFYGPTTSAKLGEMIAQAGAGKAPAPAP